MIKLIKSTFYKEKTIKKKLCNFIFNAKQLSFGQECEKFEKNFSNWQGRKNTIMVNSGSSANLAIIQALLNLEKIKKGDFVGFSAVSWSTNVMPLIQLGLRAIPIDVEIDTLNISSRNLLSVLKKYPLKMVFLTNLLGFCDDIDKIKEICDKKKILLIEDNCESLGTVYKGTKLGNFGLASTFSFYVGHHISTIEGGAITTDNEEVATMLRLVRAHGWDRNLDFVKRNQIRKRFRINTTFYSRYTFYDLGFNLRPTEICGFIGNAQLKFIEEIIKKRQNNFLKMANPIYRQTEKYFPVNFSHLEIISNFAVPIICRSKRKRNQLVKNCRNRIEIRPILGGDMTGQPFFKKHLPNLLYNCPNSKLIHEQGFYFGNNPELTNKEINEIIETVSDV